MGDNLISDLGAHCTRLEAEVADLRKQLAAEQALRKSIEGALQELSDETDYQIKEGFPTIHRLVEENNRSIAALAQTSPTYALDAAIAEAYDSALDTAADALDDMGMTRAARAVEGMREQRKEQST